MHWPQYVMLGLLLASAAIVIVREIRNYTRTSVQSTVAVFIYVASQVGVAVILHAGGFW